MSQQNRKTVPSSQCRPSHPGSFAYTVGTNASNYRFIVIHNPLTIV